MNDLDRILPHAGQCEDYLVGAMLRHPGAAEACREILPLEAFYSQGRHRTIVNVIYGRLAADAPYIDIALIGDELTRRGEIHTIGGPVVLMDLCELAVSTAGLYNHVQVVLEHYLFRLAIDTGRAFDEFGHAARMDVQGGLRRARNLLWAMSETERLIQRVRDHIQAGTTVTKPRSL